MMNPTIHRRIKEMGYSGPTRPAEKQAQEVLLKARAVLDSARAAFNEAADLMGQVCSHPREHIKHTSMSFDDTLGNYTGRATHTLTCSVCSKVLTQWEER